MSGLPPNADRLVAALADRYHIERELGQGGMATVYLAHDMRHDRRVALKVLRPELAAILGGERFLKEIRLTANLQHPHILSLFDSGEADGLVYYVMPYVEGESLRDRLTREKQLPVEDAVRIAREVADALDYAHRHGVVHRDIKPENILLHDGRAQVADFGIALAVSTVGGGTRLTETGMSLGTPHYMAPEQAMGEREITPKADVYALGCVLYEMLTAEPPFTGATAQAIIARVMTEEPRSLTLQRRTIPPHVDAAVGKALEKLPADRFASAADFAAALEGGGRGDWGTERPARRATLRPSVPRSRRPTVPWAFATLASVVALAAIGLYARERLRPRPAPPPIGRFALRLTPDVVTTVTGQAIALAPDGSRIVYVGAGSTGNQLYMRTLGQVTPAPIPGTGNAVSPFFSPDGQYVAFAIGSKLVKVAVGGGPTLPVADIGNSFRGGTWNEQDTILFADERGLHLVPAAGGQATLVVAPDSTSRESYRWPEFLPGGRAALFAISNGSVDRLAAVTLGTRAVRRFDVFGGNPHFIRRGYVTLAMMDSGNANIGSGTLVTVPFDARRLAVLGAPIPVAESVQVGFNSRTAKLGVSRDGAIAFASGSVGMGALVAVGRDGTARDLGAQPRFYLSPRFSPDGRRVAVQVADAGNDIWVYELAARTLTRLTFDRTATRPVWTPDGRRIVYERRGAGSEDLAWIPADGSAPAESLVVAPDDQAPGDFTPDGRTMVIREQASGGKRRISLVALDSARAPRPVIASAFENLAPSLSPDGRWIAYASDESGRYEIYVRPFPGPGGRWQVSKEGGNEPRWSPTGREIFFRAGTNMMAAAVQAGATFAPGEVRGLFHTTAVSGINYTAYDVSRDGRTFILAQPLAANDQTVVVLLNWFENLPARSR
jgi:serine/threonine-protein kinase